MLFALATSMMISCFLWFVRTQTTAEEIGEKVRMELLQSDGQGSWQVIENPVWEIGDKSLITKEFELEADAFMAMLSIRKEGLFSGTFNLHLSVERNIGEITYADNKFKEINVNALDKESKKENRKSKYEKALEKIEEESSDLYSLFSSNQPALQVYVVPGSHSKIPSVKRGEKLYGLADAKEKFIKTSLLDIEYP